MASSASSSTIHYADGAIYEGEVARGVPHGHGVMRYADGASYEGEWCRDKREGQGTERYPHSGSVSHEGQLLEAAHLLEGESYEGQWAVDRKHGKGTFTYESGDVYVGEYRNGLREGQGLYTYADGEGQFEGEYRADLREGYGIEIFPSGACFLHLRNSHSPQRVHMYLLYASRIAHMTYMHPHTLHAAARSTELCAPCATHGAIHRCRLRGPVVERRQGRLWYPSPPHRGSARYHNRLTLR